MRDCDGTTTVDCQERSLLASFDSLGIDLLDGDLKLFDAMGKLRSEGLIDLFFFNTIIDKMDTRHTS